MKKKVWRLQSKPTVDELKTLVETGILNKEEAKDILLREEDEVATDSLKDIKEEIKFLREMVLELSKKEPLVVYKHIYDYIEKWPRKTFIPSWQNDWIYLCSNTAQNVGDSKVYNNMSSMVAGLNTCESKNTPSFTNGSSFMGDSSVTLTATNNHNKLK